MKHQIDAYFEEPITYLIDEKINEAKAKKLQLERSQSFDGVSPDGPESEVPLQEEFSAEASPAKPSQIIDIEPIVEDENENETTKNFNNSADYDRGDTMEGHDEDEMMIEDQD